MPENISKFICPNCKVKLTSGYLGYNWLRCSSTSNPLTSGVFLQKIFSLYRSTQFIAGKVDLPKSLNANRCDDCGLVVFNSPVDIEAANLFATEKHCIQCGCLNKGMYLIFGAKLKWNKYPFIMSTIIGNIFSKTIVGKGIVEGLRNIAATYCPSCRLISFNGGK